MFSPAARKPQFAASQNNRSYGNPDSPYTPLNANRRPSFASAVSIPNRPATGTPAPWSSRLSVLARIPPAKKSEQADDSNQTWPVYVGEFPKVVRDAQASLKHKGVDNTLLAGGMDKETSLSWIICGAQLFIWSYISAVVSKKCIVLNIPSSLLGVGDIAYGKTWMLGVARWDSSSRNNQMVSDQCSSVGVVLCNEKTHALVYWPDIYSGSLSHSSWLGSENLSENQRLNSIIISAVSGVSRECIAVACQSAGQLWLYRCAPAGIHRVIVQNLLVRSTNDSLINGGYARSLIWHPPQPPSQESSRQFLLLTDNEIQCWRVNLVPNISVNKLWTHEIVGSDGDLGIKKDLAGQKHIWLLDMEVDDHGKEFTILVATLCKDRVSSSSYIQYSLLTMQYKTSFATEGSGSVNGRVLEKKAPLQIIIPKARVEDEDFLFSMKLCIGGKPSGSAVILSGDGTATVTNYWRGATRLYQFELPWDAGKVLDASVFPSAEESEGGAWVILTEKAGVWAIPEKAVLLGAVEPPERSLSRKGSSNEGVVEGEKRSQEIGSNIVPLRSSSEACIAGEKQRATLTGMLHRTAQGEEAEGLLTQMFHDFLSTGVAEGVLEKLSERGAFQKDGETNVFARLSKSIVDTLAKHWTTTRGAEFVASSVVSSLLLDKQQKHQKYLQFLALSQCHDELSSSQRYSLLVIMEHGEKLSSIIQLRELQNILSQSRMDMSGSPSSDECAQTSGALWKLIQLVGEKARRNTILLMDRDNSEVFYTKVSDLEELFYCLSHQLKYVIGSDQPFFIQMQRFCEVSNACVTVIQTAMHYRDEHKNWYPSPEGLTPWNCQPVVRSGLWSIASSIMQLSKGLKTLDMHMKAEMWSQLEGLTDVILDSYTGGITSKIECGEEHHCLMEEYCRRRDELLGCLYELSKKFTELKYQESFQGADDLERKEEIFREITKPLFLIAKRHEGYQTLWQLCYDLSDTGLLRSLMHESIGPKGGFSHFVFKQLAQNCQYSKLLRLGEEFQEELSSFLKEHKDLLWLHQIFLNQYSSASETLHTLALSLEEEMTEEELEIAHANKMLLSLTDRRRLLNLSKIATVAGKDVGFEMVTGRINADLQILKLQEDIIRQLPNDESTQDINRPLSPHELIQMCLKGGGKELSLIAFEVFALTSLFFRSSNRSLLVDCWKNATDQDDWLELIQSSTAEGWSDEVVLEFLRETLLYKASNLCYGPKVETYDGGFEDVLPLQKDDVKFPSLKDANSSVEGILMQHKDFPDAGKLMLTAVMMSKVGDSAMVVEDVVMDSA